MGSSIAISRLTELLFVQSIRFHLMQEGSDAVPSNWLKGAADQYIGQALGLMHTSPGFHWTVASLAEKIGMSRSAFALRFKEMTNTTPLEYLTSWRMHKAEQLITNGTSGLAEIATAVGYESESAFSKAFKREKGTAPGVYRRAKPSLP